MANLRKNQGTPSFLLNRDDKSLVIAGSAHPKLFTSENN
jgi:hypothetical protein